MSFDQGVQSESHASFSAQPLEVQSDVSVVGTEMAGTAPVGWASGPLATLGGAGSVTEMLSVGMLGLGPN